MSGPHRSITNYIEKQCKEYANNAENESWAMKKRKMGRDMSTKVNKLVGDAYQRQCTDAVIDLIINNLLPFSFVSSATFVSLCSLLSRGDYHPPSTNSLIISCRFHMY